MFLVCKLSYQNIKIGKAGLQQTLSDVFWRLSSASVPNETILFIHGWAHLRIKCSGWFLGPRGPLVEPSILPSRPVRNNFSWVHRWAARLLSGLRDPSNCIFYESWWCQLSNSDENTNTKTNTDTNTNTGTNKGKTNDSYDVIYCLKGDDKRILNMICYRQHL